MLRVHILGLGNIGSFVAYCLSSSSHITLLLRSQDSIRDFQAQGARIQLTQDGKTFTADRFIAEAGTSPDKGPIENLIVATKTYQTVAALGSIRHKLSSKSTILLLQNGMGVLEELLIKVFTEPTNRPHFLLSVVTHGINRAPGERFSVRLAGHGWIKVGAEGDERLGLVDALTSCQSLLGAIAVSKSELLVAQVKKLAANAVINPLTAIYDCKNGDLLDNDEALRKMESIANEVSAVMRKDPAMKIMNDKEDVFSARALLEDIHNIVRITAGNVSSMLQDVRSGRPTEIDYINGYIVRKGKELEIPTPVNEGLVHQVRSKLS